MYVQTLFKKMAKENPASSRLSVDSGPFVFHYIIGGGVCYLTLTDRCASSSIILFLWISTLRHVISNVPHNARVHVCTIHTAVRDCLDDAQHV